MRVEDLGRRQRHLYNNRVASHPTIQSIEVNMCKQRRMYIQKLQTVDSIAVFKKYTKTARSFN